MWEKILIEGGLHRWSHSIPLNKKQVNNSATCILFCHSPKTCTCAIFVKRRNSRWVLGIVITNMELGSWQRTTDREYHPYVSTIYDEYDLYAALVVANFIIFTYSLRPTPSCFKGHTHWQRRAFYYDEAKIYIKRWQPRGNGNSIFCSFFSLPRWMRLSNAIITPLPKTESHCNAIMCR